MIYPARLVKMTDVGKLEATLECPQLWGAGPRRNIQGLPIAGLKGDVPDGSLVMMVRFGDNHYRWFPNEQGGDTPPAWLERGVRGLYGPSGSVVVILDENARKVKIGGTSGLLPVVRRDDPVEIDALTDPTFWVFLQKVITAWNVAAAAGGPLVVPIGDPVSVTSIAAKNTGGSSVTESV